MDKKRPIQFLVFIACLTGGPSLAQPLKKELQPDQYRMVQWTMDEGLPYNLGNVMMKDVKGFLWIGSVKGELCRFDGAVFKKYFPEPGKPGAINSDGILSFKEDYLHNIWIGTEKGLSRYDIKADTFTNFSPYLDSAFSQYIIAPFWATPDEIYCMEPGTIITAINIHTLKRRILVNLLEKENNKFWISWNTNKSVFDEKSNSIWKLYYYEREQQGGLKQIFPDGTSKIYTWPCYRTSISHPRHGAEDMVYDPKRYSIWINSGEGLLEFSLKDKEFHRMEALDAFTRLKDYDRNVGIDIDLDGRIWFSTYSHGVFIYNPVSGHLTPLFSDPDLHKTIGKENLHIYCDRDGMVWTSYWMLRGICQLLPYHPLVKRYVTNPSKTGSLSNGLISTIFPGPQGKLWIGTANGLNVLDPGTERFEVLHQQDLPGIKGTAILPLYIDTIHRKAWLHAGFQETFVQYFTMGLYEMDLTTRQCRPIVFKDGAKIIDTVKVGHTLLKPYKNGVLLYDDFHGIFEIKEGSSTANLLIPLSRGEKGTNLFVMEEENLMFLKKAGEPANFTFENKNGKWTRIPHLLDSLFWTYILYNKKDQTYWVSSKYELIHYDKKFRELKRYNLEDGYPGFALTMQMDEAGNLWLISLSKKLCRLNPASGNFTILSEADGYRKQDYGWQIPFTRDARGNLYFGIGLKTGTDEPGSGLDRIYPERYSSAATSFVYLRSLVVNQKAFPLSSEINNLDQIELAYNQNTLRIETGLIDYYSKGKGLLRYKLERSGQSEAWQYGTAYQTILYEALPPGSYRLVMQAAISGKEFNGPEKIVGIYINPAFWQTWWFRVAAICLLGGLAYILMQWRLKQKFSLQLERSEKERQVVELQHQKTELEIQALRSQMNPHFIFNSLNSINRFILQNDKLQASAYLTKFSKLVRLILQNSQATLIPLESELEALELYLELEALRFDHHFDYTIRVEDDLDVSVLKVPPLIIQPYAENAIWHGLMHKEEKGHLEIEISQQDEILCYNIKDNGIGRKRAAELKSKSASPHKSMGMRITADRIALLQQKNQPLSYVTTTDLERPDGSAGGTEVTLKIPVHYD